MATRLVVILFVPISAALARAAWSRSQTFGFVFLLLVVYTLFTQIAHAWYPELLYAIYPHEPFTEAVFYSYWVYVVLSLSAIVVFSKPLYKLRTHLNLVRRRLPGAARMFVEMLHHLTMAGYAGVLTFFLWQNYEALSYRDQSVLKGNHLWFWLFEMSGLVMLSLWTRVVGSKSAICKVTGVAWLLVVALVSLATAIRSGQRIELFQTLMGFFGFLFSVRRWGGIRALVVAGSVALPSLLIMQGIRAVRGTQVGFTTFFEYLPEILQRFREDFSFQFLVFQDYTVPSMSLMYSIAHGVVIPLQVLLTNLVNLAVLIDYPTLGVVLSRMVDPDGWTGYGYYILTEGYNLAGMAGILYVAVVFVVGIWLLERIFGSAEDTLLRAYVQGIIAFLAIGFVRGQSLWFVKSVYMEIVPALLLFMLAHGEVLLLRKNARVGYVNRWERRTVVVASDAKGPARI